MKLRTDENVGVIEEPFVPEVCGTALTFSAQLRADQERIDHALAEYAAQWPGPRPAAAGDDLQPHGWGKAIRPLVLTLAFCRLFGGRKKRPLPLPAAWRWSIHIL